MPDDSWTQIGLTDGRRSLWVRLNWKRPKTSCYASRETIESVEFCAGREGDDFHAKFDQTNPQFGDILSMACSAMYAVDMLIGIGNKTEAEKTAIENQILNPAHRTFPEQSDEEFQKELDEMFPMEAKP
jgi:hypothetical protein